MAFFKFRQRGQPPAPEPARRGRGKDPAAKPEESIDGLRRRARHRLVGAAVLVLLAVIGFPLLFDTQPRPVAVNAPITIPDKDKAPPLKIPEPVPATASLADDEEVVTPGRPAARGASAPVVSGKPKADEAARANAKADEAARAKADEAARTKADQAARAKADEAARAKADAAKAKAEQAARAKAQADSDSPGEADARAKREQEARVKREQEARVKREQEARAKREAEQRAPRDDAARARALLEGRGNGAVSDSAKAGRFIVQVGAFADDTAVREARQKAERAGVRTYTQVVETSAGPRTRVRVGPFGSREEAEKAAATLKKAGLGSSILSL